MLPFALTAPNASAAKIIATAKRMERIPKTIDPNPANSKKNFKCNLEF